MIKNIKHVDYVRVGDDVNATKLISYLIERRRRRIEAAKEAISEISFN